MLSSNFSPNFLSLLTVLMKEQTLSPGEIIYKQGERNTTLFFVIKGEVQFDLEISDHLPVVVGTLKVIKQRNREREKFATNQLTLLASLLSPFSPVNLSTLKGCFKMWSIRCPHGV